jgi:Dynein heavy chain region D6 P-loop domain
MLKLVTARSTVSSNFDVLKCVYNLGCSCMPLIAHTDHITTTTHIHYTMNTTGADPTESIETLARRKKLPPPAVISLGEGQEPVAMRAMNAAAINGTWVLLQVCIA